MFSHKAVARVYHIAIRGSTAKDRTAVLLQTDLQISDILGAVNKPDRILMHKMTNETFVIQLKISLLDRARAQDRESHNRSINAMVYLEGNVVRPKEAGLLGQTLGSQVGGV